MSTTAVDLPYVSFPDVDGSPLDDGYIYIGTANQNPQTNPITIYWDAARTITAAQPVRTVGGFPYRNGRPARIYVGQDYSITVRNRDSELVYTAPTFTGLIGSEFITFLQVGTGAVERTVQSKERDIVSVKDFGAVCDNSTDDTAAWDLAIAAAFTAGVALYHPGGLSKVTDELDATAYYGISIYGVGHNAGPTYDNVVSGIIQYTANTPILRIQGQSNRLENLYLAYNAQQTTGNTSSTALQLNNVSGSSFRNLKFYRANTSIGIPQSAFGATSYNAVWDSLFENILSYEASECHLDLRNYQGGGTNCVFDTIYLNGGGSLDFVTAGQSCNYFIRGASWSNYTWSGVATEGGQFVQRVWDLSNCNAVINDWRCEALQCMKDNDGWLAAGGSDSNILVGLINITGCRALVANVATATYILRANSTRNILTVGAITVPTNSNSSYTTPLFRALTVGSTDATTEIRIGPIYDPSTYLGDSWTGTDHLYVYDYNGKETIEAIRAGRSTNAAFRKGCTAASLPATGATGDRADIVNPGDLGRAYQAVYSGSFIPSAFVGGQYPVVTINDELDFTLTPGTSRPSVYHTGTLTSDVAVTLSTTGAWNGARFRITRTGAGAFNINVGTGPLKALATNTWGEFVYDGGAWRLMAYGAL